MLIGLPTEPWLRWIHRQKGQESIRFNKLRAIYRKYRTFTMIDGPTYLRT